jgi:hypothetical protein
MNSFCYHTRCYRSGSKLSGGTIHADNYQDAIEKISRMFQVAMTPTGNLYYIDKQNRDVYLYISIHPEYTINGIEQVKSIRAERTKRQQIAYTEEERKRVQLESILDGISIDEAIEKLS